jgi:hypothetical protein
VAAIYHRALPQVYGYLLPRCGSTVVAEDLTAKTFLAAVAAVRQGRVGGPKPSHRRRRAAQQGARFRNDIVTGVGVRQILIQDPSGNLTELFEPLAAYHERSPGAVGRYPGLPKFKPEIRHRLSRIRCSILCSVDHRAF